VTFPEGDPSLRECGCAPTSDQSLALHAAIIALKGVRFLVVVAVLAIRVLPGVTTHLARTPELLVLAGIAWAVALAAVGEALG